MKIINLLYIKYTLAFSICLVSSLTIFFIFSLIGNLNEGYFFSVILKISFLNSLQILSYVPAFIFLITIVLFLIFLRSKNEIIIIKSYLNINRLVLFFLPIAILFTTLEINKSKISKFIDKYESNMINTNNILNKIVIHEHSNLKIYNIFNKLNLEKLNEAQFHSYEIENDKIKKGEFSNSLLIFNNKVIARNYTQYNENSIKDYATKKTINSDFIELINQNSIVRFIAKQKKQKIDFKNINMFLFFIIFFYFIFFIFFSTKIISSKENLKFPIILSLSILLYSFFVFNNNLNFYKNEFEFIGSLIIVIFFLKAYLNE